MSGRRNPGSGLEPPSIAEASDLDRTHRPAQGGERRIKKQENVIAMLKVRPLPSERADEGRVLFGKSRDTHAQRRQTPLADEELATGGKSHEH